MESQVLFTQKNRKYCLFFFETRTKINTLIGKLEAPDRFEGDFHLCEHKSALERRLAELKEDKK